MQQIQWQDRFSIGVEIVDQAHHKLFSIVQKIMELYIEKHEDRFACIEGIKYFKAYALQHFAEEEAYMREIGYPGYFVHKRHHDRMKQETLPTLEKTLYESNFSTEAVQRFIGVCTGWLTGHIMIEDRAITGKISAEFSLIRPGEDELSIIYKIITHPLQEMFGPDIRYIGRFSTKDTILDAQYYEMIYRSLEGDPVQFVLVIGEHLLLQAASSMFGMNFYAKNETVRFAVQEIAQNLIQRATSSFGKEANAYQLEEDRFLEQEEYYQTVQGRIFQYSLLFRAKQECFAICIDSIPAIPYPVS